MRRHLWLLEPMGWFVVAVLIWADVIHLGRLVSGFMPFLVAAFFVSDHMHADVIRWQRKRIKSLQSRT